MNKFVRSADAALESAQMSRRTFMIGAAGAGFTLAFARADLVFADPAAAVVAKAFEPSIWYDIDADGIVTVNIIRAEMGQHVGTALARIVADELGADWNSVRIKAVDTDPKWGIMVTGGSWSVWQSFPYLSQAGAAGRIALIEEGAKLLGVAKESCRVENSKVVSGAKSIGYGDIVRRGNLTRTYTADELKAMPIKKAADRTLIGKPVKALDLPQKTNGSGIYGIDARVEGMVFARPKLPPSRNGCKVVSIDDSAAKGIKGYQQSIALEDPSGTVPGWVVVVADSFTAANLATDKVVVQWSTPDAVKVSEQNILDEGKRLVDAADGGSFVVNDDGVDQAFAGAASKVEQTYTTSTVLHFQLEPVNALAFQKDGIWEIHTGNQWQSLILPSLVKALGVTDDKVVMRTYLLGGGFGRRLNGDYAVPAALASKALGGKPVKLVWTRADDARFDSPRSPSVQRLAIAFDADKKVVGMQHHAAAGWPTKVMAAFFMPKGKNGEPYDPFSIAGADNWYTVGAQRVRAISNELANTTFRPGWLRSVGPGWTNWALESFIDEAAHSVGVDAVEFRLRMLDGAGRNAGDDKAAVGGAKRQAAVVKRAAEKAGWGGTLPADTGLGLATSFGQERDMPTWSACVARVKVDRASGAVKLEKLTLVVDAGTIVDPDSALAQCEGALLWGTSMALHEGTAFVNGLVKDTNLDSYTPLRMRDVPELDIEFLPSTEVPVGLGEPATTVVGPAVGNAIFNAVGVRLRHIPIRPVDVVKALQRPA
jgi:isoquinoline 1-oxidoreductase beta subunit